MSEETTGNGKGNGAVLRLDINGLAKSLIVAAMLSSAAYVWAGLQRVPDPEVIRALQADVAQAKIEAARTTVQMNALAANVEDIKAHLAEIERLLRARNARTTGEK